MAAQAGAGGCCAARRRQRGAWQVVRAEADFYDTLGVPRNADKKAIKSAYRCGLLVRAARCRTVLLVCWAKCSAARPALCCRQKARKFHPDVNKEPGAEETFKRISNAYEVLSDDQKRSIYDRCACWRSLCCVSLTNALHVVPCCLHGLSSKYGDLPGRPAVTMALANGLMIEALCAEQVRRGGPEGQHGWRRGRGHGRLQQPLRPV